MVLKQYIAYETSAWDDGVVAAKKRATEVRSDILERGIWRGRRVEQVMVKRVKTKSRPRFQVLVYSRT